MELAGSERTLERVLLALVLVLLVLVLTFLVINMIQQRGIQAAVQQTQQAVQQTRVELKQFKEDVPHREFSSPFPTLPGGSFHLSLLASLPLTNQLTHFHHPQSPT